MSVAEVVELVVVEVWLDVPPAAPLAPPLMAFLVMAVCSAVSWLWIEVNCAAMAGG